MTGLLNYWISLHNAPGVNIRTFWNLGPVKHSLRGSLSKSLKTNSIIQNPIRAITAFGLNR